LLRYPNEKTSLYYHPILSVPSLVLNSISECYHFNNENIGAMKNLFCLVTFLITSIAFSQSKQQENTLQISIVEKSDAPLSHQVHNYTYTVTNNSSKNIQYTITTKQITCKEKYSEMSVKALTSSFNKATNIHVNARSSKPFIIEMKRNNLTKLDTWSCVQINAIDNNGVPISNTVTLSQFTPDTRNFQ